MDRSSQASHVTRCPEHDLAVGPAGECVLCRRARSAPPAPARWLSPVLLVAALGSALLGGVVLGRRHTPSPALPSAEVTTAAPAPSAEAPAETSAVAANEPSPRERPAAPGPAPAPAPPQAPPQRNYLDEAYATMPKGNLYDDAPARPAPAQPTASASARPAPRPHMGMGGHGRTGVRH